MIWIATLFLLAVAAWLFYNGLNEKRWVEAHAHDEAVASDPGILPDFGAITRSASTGISDRLSVRDENSLMSRGIASIDQRTAGIRDRVEQRVKKAREESDFFERVSTRVNQATSGVSESIERRVQQARDRAPSAGRSVTEEDSLLGRGAAFVSQQSEKLGSRITGRHRDETPAPGEKVSIWQEQSLLGRMVRGMTRRFNGVDERIEQRVARDRDAREANPGGTSAQDDLAGQVAAKLGKGLDELDDKIVKN